jgi:hypothetical protein
VAFAWALGNELMGAAVPCTAFAGCNRYHAPPAITKTPAAIAPYKTPLPEPLDERSCVMTGSSSGSKLPTAGSDDSGMLSSAVTDRGSSECSSRAAKSLACLAFSRSTSSWADAEAAALRASGSSHDGIFTSSVSSDDFMGGGRGFAGVAALTGKGSDFAISKTCAVTLETTFGSGADAAGAGATGFAVGAALKSNEESCSCRRAAWSFRSSLEFWPAAFAGCCLFSDATGGAGGVNAVKDGGASGALKRLAREDAREDESGGAVLTGTSGFFAIGATGAALIGSGGVCGLGAAGGAANTSAGRGWGAVFTSA